MCVTENIVIIILTLNDILINKKKYTLSKIYLKMLSYESTTINMRWVYFSIEPALTNLILNQYGIRENKIKKMWLFKI